MDNSISDEIQRELETLSDPQLRVVLKFVHQLKDPPEKNFDIEKVRSLIGSIPKDDLEIIRRFIDEDCERIDYDGW